MATPIRTIRIPDELWESLQDKAAEKDTDASTVIRELIDKWIKKK